MTSTNLDALIAAANLDQVADRLMLADALTEAGREKEADLCRDCDLAVRLIDGVLRELSSYSVEMRGEGGDSDTEEFDAIDDDEAVKEARRLTREWIRGGDWGSDGATIEAGWTLFDGDEDEIDSGLITVEIEPDHDALIRAAGGDPDCDHDWTAEGEGGCDENPGVWSTGGTSFTFASHCRLCGLHRTEHTCGSQRNPGERDTTSYTQPSNWCAECQCEECECDETAE